MSFARYAVTDDVRCARHETGHALVAYWSQIPVTRIQVAGGGGETIVNFGLHRTAYDLAARSKRDGADAVRSQVQRIVQVLLAGAMAEDFILVRDDATHLAAWKATWQEATARAPLGSWTLLALEAERQVRRWFAAPGVERLLDLMTALVHREGEVTGDRFARVTRNHSARLGITTPPTTPAPAAREAVPLPPKPKIYGTSTPTTRRSPAPVGPVSVWDIDGFNALARCQRAARVQPVENIVLPPVLDWRTGGMFPYAHSLYVA